jgi:hypothetical protein
MTSYLSMSQSTIEYQINDTNANKNGEANSKSSDVVPYLDIEELTAMRDDMKQQSKKRVQVGLITHQYEKFFIRRMSNVPQMVRVIEARVEELVEEQLSNEYDKDWTTIQVVKPIKINKAVA